MPILHTGAMANDMKWLAPESALVKLNTYGVISLNSYLAAIGGVIKDAYGAFKAALESSATFTSSLVTLNFKASIMTNDYSSKCP
ncbi:hypothetical protein J1N35_029229 [Gossypium stocksii]|uniref:Uncharacterized protein n=1 Tax=Gossypium stocksii TaxID=47602 RepID=A0A9D3UYH8_9ROSI|nr:hypothetical protein J1N35_029229 [Gossypium stocksii]